MPFLLLFLREILHIAKIGKIWENTRPYDKKLFSPKENVSNTGMIVEQIPVSIQYIILIIRHYPFPVFLLKRKVPEKIHELSIQRQDTVGDILIDNLKPDAFKNGFLKAFCNTIKIVEHTARFLGKRNITVRKVT